MATATGSKEALKRYSRDLFMALSGAAVTGTLFYFASRQSLAQQISLESQPPTPPGSTVDIGADIIIKTSTQTSTHLPTGTPTPSATATDTSSPTSSRPPTVTQLPSATADDEATLTEKDKPTVTSTPSFEQRYPGWKEGYEAICRINDCVTQTDPNGEYTIITFILGDPIEEPIPITTSNGEILGTSILTQRLFLVDQDQKPHEFYSPWLVDIPGIGIWDVNNDRVADSELITYLLEGGLKKEGYITGRGIHFIMANSERGAQRNIGYLRGTKIGSKYLDFWARFTTSWEEQINSFIKTGDPQDMEVILPLKSPGGLLYMTPLPPNQ